VAVVNNFTLTLKPLGRKIITNEPGAKVILPELRSV